MFGTIQAGLAFYHVYDAWEKQDMDKYGSAVQFLYDTVPEELLYQGFTHNGKRIFVDRDVVGRPLRIVNVN